jgi:4-amino-4-deoxy-L-arabinose transferase-like glycosyltransferase
VETRDDSLEPSAIVRPGLKNAWIVEAALVGLLALTLNLLGNGRVSLWDRDEPRYAGCTREMRVSGDWIHPTFNAEPRYHKPVLIYWLMLAGTAIGGDNPFGARLASAVAGTGTVLLVWAWGRRMLGDRAGRMAALVLATAPIMVAESKLATTDATLTFFVVGCQFALWELSREPSRRAAGVFWLFLGLAILTKSPAGPILIAASAIASWWWGGSTAYLRRLHWRWGPLVALAIVAPWNIAILLRSDGAYYNVAVGYHIVRRATTGIEEHGGFPGYYLATGLLIFCPWSALLPAALAAAWAKRRETPLAGFLIGWVIGPLVLLECVRTKLIHYYLPAVPAAALLVGWLVARLTDHDSGVAFKNGVFGRIALGTVAAVGSVLAIGLGASAFVIPTTMRAPAVCIGVFAAVGTAFFVRELMQYRIERAVLGLVGATAVSLATVGGWLLPAAEPYRISASVGRRLAALEAREGGKVVLCTFQFPGTVFALGHPAPIVHSRTELFQAAQTAGKVVTALMPEELAKCRARPEFTIEVHETIEGFDLDKGRPRTIYLTVIEPTPIPSSFRGPLALSDLSALPVIQQFPWAAENESAITPHPPSTAR